MKEVIPRQMFDIAIQAAIGSQIIARCTVKALRKDVLANVMVVISLVRESYLKTESR